MTEQKTNKIEIENTEITCSTEYQEVEGNFNDKHFVISRWISTDRNVGVTDEGLDFLDDTDSDITDEEKEEIKEYVQSEVKWE